MKATLIDIGQGNAMAPDLVLAILKPGSAPGKRLKDQAAQAGLLVDATGGKLTRSMVVTVSNHLILSNLTTHELTAAINKIMAQGA
jgi:regulator of extracellular matrix RemA (YlzA/DUF370 family)